MTQIEDWLRQTYGLSEDKTLREQLEPLVHASQLLQLKKQNETDAVEICSMCTALNPQQVGGGDVQFVALRFLKINNLFGKNKFSLRLCEV